MGSTNDHSDDHRDDEQKFEDRCNTYHRGEDHDLAAEDASLKAAKIDKQVAKALAKGDWETALKAQGDWPVFQAVRDAGVYSGGPASGSGRESDSEISGAIHEANRELDVVSRYLSVEATFWIRRFLAGISPQEDHESRRRKHAQLVQVAGQLKAWQPAILGLLAEKLRRVAHELTSRA